MPPGVPTTTIVCHLHRSHQYQAAESPGHDRRRYALRNDCHRVQQVNRARKLLCRHRRQRDRAEQAAISERPVGSVEGLVIDVHDVDVLEGFPRHAAPVEVANAVGGDAGNFHFERVAGGF